MCVQWKLRFRPHTHTLIGSTMCVCVCVPVSVLGVLLSRPKVSAIPPPATARPRLCPVTFLAHKMRLMDANSISLFLLPPLLPPLFVVVCQAKSHSTPAQLTWRPFSNLLTLRHWLLCLQISVKIFIRFYMLYTIYISHMLCISSINMLIKSGYPLPLISTFCQLSIVNNSIDSKLAWAAKSLSQGNILYHAISMQRLYKQIIFFIFFFSFHKKVKAH